MTTYSGKVRTLGKLLLKLETRSRTGSNRKLLLLNITYLLPGIFLPLLLVKQNTDPTGFEYSFLTFLFFSLILTFTVITELDNLIVSRTEAEIFSAMPIDNGLLVNAKMFVITRYTFFLSLPLLLPGSFFYYTIMRSFPRTFVYFISGFMLLFFTVNILILLYSMALRNFKAKNLGTYSMMFQFLMIFIMIIAYQLVSFGVTGREGSNISTYISILSSKGLINVFPQSWFAFLAARNTYLFEIALIFKLFLPLVICSAAYYSLKLYLLESYPEIREKFIDSRMISTERQKKPRFFLFSMFSDLIQDIYLRNNSERSSYGLLSSMYKRDKSVRLSIVPMIIIPAGLAMFALFTNQLPPPFSRGYFELRPVFHISLLLCVLVVLNTAMLAVKVSSYNDAAWVYDSYPLGSKRHFRNGFRKFFVIYLLIPVCVLLGIIFIFKIPFDQALLHTLFIFAAANLYNSVSSLFSKKLPFTKESTMINSLQRMSAIFYPFLYGILIIMLQLYVYRSMLTTAIAVLALVVITFWVNYFGFVRHKP